VTLSAQRSRYAPEKRQKTLSLFKKETSGGFMWYARFWDEIARRYAVARSLGIIAEGKKERRYEAEQAARKMLPGIKFERAEEKTLIRYLEDFWTPDSPYAREAALVKKRPLSAYYVKMNHEAACRPFSAVHGGYAWWRPCQIWP